jgi:hypothetical protein
MMRVWLSRRTFWFSGVKLAEYKVAGASAERRAERRQAVKVWQRN